MRYADSSMVTQVRARNPKLGVELLCNDVVDFYENVLIRRVRVTNLADRPREIRCFFHHDFHIWRERGRRHGVLFSRGGGPAALQGRPLLPHELQGQWHTSGCSTTPAAPKKWGEPRAPGGTPRTACSVGTPWRKARSTPRSACRSWCRRQETGEFYYWMAAGRDFREAFTIDEVVRDKSPEELLRRTGNYWRLWVGKDRRGTADLPQR